MNALLTSVVPSIIGQIPLPTLAAVRSPSWLPFSVSSLLFETQWLYWVILILIGAVLFFAGAARNKKGMLGVGRGVLVVAIVWILAASLVDSPLERLEAAHKAIVAAAQTTEGHKADPEKIIGYLTDDFRFANTVARDTTAAAIRATLEAIKVKTAIVTAYKATPVSGDTVRSHLAVVTNLEGTGDLPLAGGALSQWDLEWVDVPGQDWRLRAVLRAALGDGKGKDAEITPDLKLQ